MKVNYQKVGERLKTLRELRGLSLGELEKKTDFTQKSILLAEHGQAALNLDFLVQMSDALDVTPNDILVGQYRKIDAAASDKDALIKAFLLKIELLQNNKGDGLPNMTKIKDTGIALSEMKQVVDDNKRNNRDKKSENTPKNNFKYF